MNQTPENTSSEIQSNSDNEFFAEDSSLSINHYSENQLKKNLRSDSRQLNSYQKSPEEQKSQDNSSHQFQNHLRELDRLYNHICVQKKSPKESLRNTSYHQKTKKILMQANQANKISKISNENQLHKVKSQNSRQFFSLEAINYKKLLERQMKKSFELENKLHQMEMNFSELSQNYNGLKKQNQELNSKLLKQIHSRKKEQQMIINLDNRLITLKKKQKNIENLNKVNKNQSNKQNSSIHNLKEENLNYHAFISALMESIRILKGKKCQDLAELWTEWKNIFQIASVKKCKASEM